MRILTLQERRNLSKAYEYGDNPVVMGIRSCTDPNEWYADKVGQNITVKYYASFSAYDMQNRWMYYYDLGKPF